MLCLAQRSCPSTERNNAKWGSENIMLLAKDLNAPIFATLSDKKVAMMPLMHPTEDSHNSVLTSLQVTLLMHPIEDSHNSVLTSLQVTSLLLRQ